ncbi:MAG TPA: UvrD-helicase domain-containing protein [Planctomycetaceae bacterium]|nr:UvrD-helicase domain-containing protein [Planctomycetaceae bacterium]
MSLPIFTEQQAAAVNTRGVSIGLSAGAGCGKTFVLTQRFLAHLEPGPRQTELHHLVAITFTDRAAREMRDRVREACQQRLEHCPADQVEHWLTMLRGLDAARISTIHSFCTSLLRANAVEAGLDPRFSVLEAPLADTLLTAAGRETVHRLLIADDPDAVAFVLRFGLERTRELAAWLAGQRFRVDWNSWQERTPEDVAQSWINDWHQKFVPSLLKKLREGPTAQLILTVLKEYTPTHPGMLEARAELLTRLSPDAVWPDPITELAIIREAAKVQGRGGKSVWPNEDVFAAVRDSFSDLRGEIDSLTKLLEFVPGDVHLAADLACRGFRLARAVAEEYDRGKAAAGALDFDDLLLGARNLLRDREEVRHRFAQGIKLLMVDEFQDTDPVQADIVRMLCGEALAHGKLFLVGDVKQSIYRFRRADPDVFRNLREELPPGGQLSLTRNFRSQPEILRFVNLLFQKGLPRYEPLVPFVPKQLSPPPCVEFLWATTDAVPDLNVDPDEKPSAQRLRDREADWIARRIAELLADPTPRIRDDNGLRRVLAGDIVILFRALTNVSGYEAALRDYGLDYYLVGGKTFYAQQEVFDLLNLCRTLDDPDDLVALIGVLRSPFFGLDDDSLHALRPDDGDWHARLMQPPPAFLSEQQRGQIQFAGRTLAWLRGHKDRMPIAELLTAAVDRTGYDAALLVEYLGRRKVANLRKLIEQAATFDQGEAFTLKDYVERLKTSVLEETDEEFATTQPETGDVIRLMSVHQSKGLEFPVVFVADINRKGPPKVPWAYLHPEWGALVRIPEEFGVAHDHLALRMLKLQEDEADEEESLRLFYVATTRAADHLILSAGLEPDLKPTSPWMRLLAEQFQLDTGLPKGDPTLGVMAGVADWTEIPAVLRHHHPPQAEKVAGTRDAIPLKELIESVQNAEPQPLPEVARVIDVDRSAPGVWSVSQLEEIDAVLSPIAKSHHDSGEDSERSGELGDALHHLLEVLDYGTRDDWRTGLATALAAERLSSDATLRASIDESLDRFVQSDVAARLSQAPRRFAELDFLLPWSSSFAPRKNAPFAERKATLPSDLVTGQIDLIYGDDATGWHVRDFKTGNYVRDLSDVEILAPYTFQLGVYALAAEQWLGQSLRSIGLILVRPTVREVVWTWDDDAREAIKLRLSAAVRQPPSLESSL